MNRTRIATVALVVLLAVPVVAAGYSNGPAATTDSPQPEFAAMADEQLLDRGLTAQSVSSPDGQGAIGQSGVIDQQSPPATNGTTTANGSTTGSGTTADEPTTASGQTDSPDADFEVVDVSSSLEPGETATRQLEVDAEDVDNPSQIPLTIDFQYETTSNEVRQAQAPPAGIAVVAAESGFITGPIVVGAVLVIVVLGGLIWYLQ